MPATAAQPPSRRSRLRRAALLAAPALALLALGGLFFFTFHAPRVLAAADRRWLGDLSFRADIRQAAIESGLREALADARVAGRFPSTLELCRPRAGGADAALLEHLRVVLGVLAGQDEISNLEIVSDRGETLAASRGGEASRAALAIARRAIESGHAALDLVAEVDGRGAHVLGAEPLACAGLGAGSPRAAVVVEMDARSWLYPLLETRPVSGAATLESILVRREGERVVVASPLRLQPAPPFSLSLPAATEYLASARALSGPPTEGAFLDYRGVVVLAALRPIRDTGWGLVVKLDLAEARQAAEQRLLLESLVGGFGLLSFGLATSAVLLARRRALAARLAAERVRFAAALDQANDAILFLSDDARIVDLNRRSETLYGRSRAELLGLPDAELWAPELRAGAAATFAELRARGHLIVETVHQRADGTTFPVEISARRLEAGAEGVVVAIVRDISAGRQAEESFRRLFDGNPFPTWIFDLETLRFVAVNDAAVALYGYSRAEFLAMSVADIRPPEDLSEFEARIAKVRREPAPSTGYRTRHRRRDGSLLEVEIYSSPHVFQGSPARVVVIHDVTTRSRAERDLRKLTRAVEQSSASVVITDLDGNIEYVNPKFCELTGYSPEEALGHNPRILKSGVTPDATYREMWATLAAGRVWQGELCNRRKDGSLFWEEASISPLVESDGRVTHYVAVKEDVTERRRLAAELEQAQRLEAIGRLAGGVAHDINNILAVIGGITDLVLDELPADSPRHADLLEVRAAVERGAGLTAKLLAFGRRRPAEPRAVDLGSLVRGVASMLGRLLGEQIELVLDLPERVGAVRVDPAGIEQVLINLALNARDAMPDGGRLTIALAERRIEAGASGALRDVALGEFVELAVSDTGTGIPAAIRDHLFEPFVTTKEIGRGTGLGLAVVHGVVTQAQGAIRVESEPGRGSTFRILLPRSAEPAPPVRLEAPPRPTAGGGETVLVAEDDRAVRSLVERMLRVGGYRVLVAAGGEEALRLLAEEPGPVALLVTDVGMPGMSGHDLAERVRAARPGTPVLLISGHLGESEPDAGARGESFLAKPFDAKALLAAAREAIVAAARRPS